MKTAMVFCPHADDAAAFCGGTLAKMSHQGWEVVLVRVTDDCKDSLGLTREETIRRNTQELHRAAEIMGITTIVELGFETDCLADVSEVALRERFVYLLRKHRPYAIFSFDPFGLYEGNLDHVRVAQAVEEALWVSCFDLHHPAHFEEGLEPFTPCERWYFGRKLPGANHAEDVTDFMETKVKALCAHETMMRNTVNQARLQLRTWGKRVAWLDQSVEGGEMRPLLALFLQEQANAVAESFELGDGRMGEVFRRERFGDLEELFQELGEELPDAEAPVSRPDLDPEPVAAPSQDPAPSQIFPHNLSERIRLMGHHHLCVGAMEELMKHDAFRAVYAELVQRVKPTPDLLVESIFGYDLFCYVCNYWSNEEGRCSTGWRNKISKDAAVLAHLGLKPGDVTRLEDLQRLLAEKVSPEDHQRFCASGEWKCEMYLLGICQKAYERLRRQF